MVMDPHQDMLERNYARVLELLDGMAPGDALEVLGHASAQVIAQTVWNSERQDKVIDQLVSYIRATVLWIQEDEPIN